LETVFAVYHAISTAYESMTTTFAEEIIGKLLRLNLLTPKDLDKLLSADAERFAQHGAFIEALLKVRKFNQVDLNALLIMTVNGNNAIGADLLIQAGADPTLDSLSLLIKARRRGYKEVENVLLRHGVGLLVSSRSDLGNDFFEIEQGINTLIQRLRPAPGTLVMEIAPLCLLFPTTINVPIGSFCKNITCVLELLDIEDIETFDHLLALLQRPYLKHRKEIIRLESYFKIFFPELLELLYSQMGRNSKKGRATILQHLYQNNISDLFPNIYNRQIRRICFEILEDYRRQNYLDFVQAEPQGSDVLVVREGDSHDADDSFAYREEFDALSKLFLRLQRKPTVKKHHHNSEWISEYNMQFQWKVWQGRYKQQFPGKEEKGYGPGAVVPYSPKS